jgi:hypothetical protein
MCHSQFLSFQFVSSQLVQKRPGIPVSRAGSAGFTVEQLVKALRELSFEIEPKRR